MTVSTETPTTDTDARDITTEAEGIARAIDQAAGGKRVAAVFIAIGLILGKHFKEDREGLKETARGILDIAIIAGNACETCKTCPATDCEKRKAN